MGKVKRLTSVGNLLIQGELDEISNIKNRITAVGNLFVTELDEYALELDSTNVVQRELSTGALKIKGEFDEVTKLEVTGGGGGGGPDTNLAFTITSGTYITATRAAGGVQHTFATTGSITSTVGTGGDGTWYNGTATGSNFEIQIFVVTTDDTITIAGESIGSGPNYSNWYSLGTTRTITFNSTAAGLASIEVSIREIANPTNIITQAFDYEVT